MTPEKDNITNVEDMPLTVNGKPVRWTVIDAVVCLVQDNGMALSCRDWIDMTGAERQRIKFVMEDQTC